MKLVTFRTSISASPRLGVLRDEGVVLDIAATDPHPAFSSMQALIEGGPEALANIRAVDDGADRSACLGAGEFELLSPLPQPVQMRDCLCFEDHLINAIDGRNAAAGISRSEAQQKRIDLFRTRPFWYKCNRFAVTGTGTEVRWPSYSKFMDYELEMAAVIGRKGVDIAKEDAASYIFGYTIFNDFSARDAQNDEMATLGPSKSKDFDNANVLGPCIVTADAFDPKDARMIARVNGEVQSEGHSSTMFWSFEDLITFVSQGETIYPGEILGSGTVGGGCGLEQGRKLSSGDVVELEIEGIGMIRNCVLAG